MPTIPNPPTDGNVSAFAGSLDAFPTASTIKPGTAPAAQLCAHGVALHATCANCAHDSWADQWTDEEKAHAAALRAERAEHTAKIEADREAHAAKLEAEIVAIRAAWLVPPIAHVPGNIARPSNTAVVPALPAMITTGNKEKYEACADYVERTLESDGLLSFDEFRGAVMLQRGVVPVPMTDEDLSAMRVMFEREKNFATVGKELMRDMCRLVAKRRCFDSGRTWLESLVWDGVPRVDTFMATHFGAVDDEYTRAVGRYMWTGLAARMLEPGCQLDMVIALLSPQGLKKSTGLKALVPERDWFTDGLSLHEDTADFKRQLKGKVVVEISELAGLGRADINVVKRVITRTDERWIEKWQTDETVYLRRCMLFASTNDERFLPPDPTGQRRWLPIEITGLDRELITRDRAQLWAEGAAMFKQSGIAYSDAERLAKGRHARHEQSDIWVDRIREWLNTPPATGGPTPNARPLTLGEVLEGAVRLQPAQLDGKAEKRAAVALRELGYVNQNMRVGEGRGAPVMRRWVLNVPPPPGV